MNINAHHFLWVEKYRPNKIEDCILSDELKNIFKDFVEQKQIPNLLLVGSAGTGKTTVAKALCNELDLEYLMINGSEEGNIDTLRTKIKGFASTVSFNDSIKVVILDEADYLNPQSTMPALRGFIEEYAENCRFILTCNFENKIIDPLHSRLVRINFTIPNDEKPKIAKQLFTKSLSILDTENVKYDKNAVANLIKKYFPDNRKVINELQRYSVSGIIDAGILVNLEEESLKSLIGMLKSKDFRSMRRWVGEHSDVDISMITKALFKDAENLVDSNTEPNMILIMDEYLYKSAFVADREINTVAMLTEIMAGVEFK